MPGRHSSAPRRRRGRTPRKLPALVAVVPLAVGGVLFAAYTSIPGLDGCSGSLEVSVDAAAETVDVLDEAASQLEKDGARVDGKCVDYRVRAAAPSEVAHALDAGEADVPDLWVPDASTLLERIDGFDGEATVVARSLARSPVVVAGRDLARPRSWREVLARDDIRLVDPLHNSAGAAALLALSAEAGSAKASADRIDAVMGPLAQRVGDDSRASRDLEQLALRRKGAAVLSEQQLLDLRARGIGRGIDAHVPATGTMLLDYPLVVLSGEGAAKEAAGQLADYLASPDGEQLLEKAGFRTGDLDPHSGRSDLGKVHVLATPAADVVGETLRRWSVLTVPTRILGVFDVSGSMDERAGGSTRIGLATEASAAALGVFPGHARIGMWAFSSRLGGPHRDHRELVKIRRLDAQVGRHGQRQLLGRALAGLPRLTHGGTGLYDTTLAAVRAVRSDYDENAVNTVVLLTDGKNEDPGSISLRQLLKTLWFELDPDRPVSVIAIGIGPDADAHALRSIVSVTSGRSYIARDAADIGKVFEQALLNR